MLLHRTWKRGLTVAVVGVAIVLVAQGCSDRHEVSIQSQVREAISECVQNILHRQLADGAFAQNDDVEKPESRVWIAPYFANHAALALLAQDRVTGSETNRAAVRNWLNWCVSHQNPAGFWNDFEGTVADSHDNGKVDAWDSSAAMYLLVASRYQNQVGELTPQMIEAACKALGCIQAVTDSDGLTWARPDHHIKYLMDNIEVAAGLVAAAELFERVRDPQRARTARDRAARIARALPGYWNPRTHLYAYALHPDGTYEAGLETLYPHGLAQLFGLTFVSPHRQTWDQLSARFQPEHSAIAAAGPERWYPAAAQIDGPTGDACRKQLLDAIPKINSPNAYIHRPALAVLALLEPNGWMRTQPTR
jgi:hypothetical protein